MKTGVQLLNYVIIVYYIGWGLKVTKWFYDISGSGFGGVDLGEAWVVTIPNRIVPTHTIFEDI